MHYLIILQLSILQKPDDDLFVKIDVAKKSKIYNKISDDLKSLKLFLTI